MKRFIAIASFGLTVVAAGALVLSSSSAREPQGVTQPVRAVGPYQVARIPWGLGKSHLAHRIGTEAASEGPMSFAVTAPGELVVLDQINFRVAKFNTAAQLVSEIPIPAETFQDIEVLPDGRIVLLDRLVRASLLVLDPSGQTIREERIVGDGIEEGGRVTSMLAASDGIWLEYHHSHRVRVLDSNLAPVKRQIEAGRALSSKADLMGEIDYKGGARIWAQERGTDNALQRVDVQFGNPIARIVWLETDSQQKVHAVFHLLEYHPEDFTRVTFEGVVGVRYDENLVEEARWASQHVITELEQFREFRVMPDGTIYQMAFQESGVLVQRWGWQP